MAAGFTHNMMYREFLDTCRKQRVGTVIPSAYAIVYNQSQEEVISNFIKIMELNKEAYDALLPIKRTLKDVVFTAQPVFSSYTTFTYEITPSVRRIIKVSVMLDGINTPVKCVLIKGNESTDILNGIFSRPSTLQCYYTKETVENIIRVYVPTGTTTVTGHIEYYTEPTLVTATDVIGTGVGDVSMFNKEVCDEIIKTAARMYIERVQDPRYSTYLNELKQ